MSDEPCPLCDDDRVIEVMSQGGIVTFAPCPNCVEEDPDARAGRGDIQVRLDLRFVIPAAMLRDSEPIQVRFWDSESTRRAIESGEVQPPDDSDSDD